MSASENLEYFEGAVDRSHVVFNTAAYKDLQKREANVLGNWEHLATLSPSVV